VIHAEEASKDVFASFLWYHAACHGPLQLVAPAEE
jgi:hypothetical protein